MNEASFENKRKLRKAKTAHECEAVVEGKLCSSYIQALWLSLSLENMGVNSRKVLRSWFLA